MRLGKLFSLPGRLAETAQMRRRQSLKAFALLTASSISTSPAVRAVSMLRSDRMLESLRTGARKKTGDMAINSLKSA